MNEKDLSKNTMEEIPEGNIEKVEEQPKNKKALRDLLVIVLILAAFPIVFRGGGAVPGVVLAIMVAAATIVMLPFCVTLGLLFAGGLEVFAGVRSLSESGGNGATLIGFGILLLGLAVLTLFLSFKFYKKCIPWLIRKIKGFSDKTKKFAEESEKI